MMIHQILYESLPTFLNPVLTLDWGRLWRPHLHWRSSFPSPSSDCRLLLPSSPPTSRGQNIPAHNQDWSVNQHYWDPKSCVNYSLHTNYPQTACKSPSSAVHINNSSSLNAPRTRPLPHQQIFHNRLFYKFPAYSNNVNTMTSCMFYVHLYRGRGTQGSGGQGHASGNECGQEGTILSPPPPSWHHPPLPLPHPPVAASRPLQQALEMKRKSS